MNRNIITITAGVLFLFSRMTPAFAASSIQFGAASSTVAENAGEVLLSVTRTGDVDTVVTVDYLTADNSAKAGEDYTTASGTLNFAAGQTNQTLRINILNDGLREAAETFSVTLTNPSPNAVLGLRISKTVSSRTTTRASKSSSRSIGLKKEPVSWWWQSYGDRTRTWPRPWTTQRRQGRRRRERTTLKPAAR